MENQNHKLREEILPLIPLKNVVMFPRVTNGLSIGRPFSVMALEDARRGDSRVVFVAQKTDGNDTPNPSQLYEIGTIGQIKQVFTGDSDTKVLVQGETRVKIIEFIEHKPFYRVRVQHLPIKVARETSEIKALLNALSGRFREYVNLIQGFPMEIFISILSTKNPHDFVNLIISQLETKILLRQKLLEETNLRTRLDMANKILSEAIEVSKLVKIVTTETEASLGKMQ